MASGKSTVSRFIESLRDNTLVVDADRVAKDIYGKNQAVLDELRKVFGNSVFKSDKEIDYPFLARLVFSDKRRLKKLNEIMFPLVKSEIEDIIKRNRDKSYIVVDAAGLFGSGLSSICDYIILVKAGKKRRKVLLKKKNPQFSEDEINLRIEGQYLKIEPSKAHFVIDNNGSLEDLQKKVDEILIRIEDAREKI